MVVKYEMFMNCIENVIGICKKQIWLPNKEYVRDHRCERTNVAYKCKIFEAVTLRHHGHYTYVCTVLKMFAINAKNKMSTKQGIH